MVTTASGVVIPGNDPSTVAATPIERLWNELGESLNGRIVVPVATVTARSALVTELQGAGYVISAANPVFVYRADAPAWARVEVTEDGTTWRPVTGSDSGWTTPSKHTSWDARTTFQSRLIGNRVHLQGLIQHDTNNTLAASNNAGVLTLPAGHRPPASRRLAAVRWVASGIPEFREGCAISVHASGAVDLHVVDGTTGAFVDGLSFTTD